MPEIHIEKHPLIPSADALVIPEKTIAADFSNINIFMKYLYYIG